MSETIPGYGPLPEPPVGDRRALSARIAMYLHARCGDEQGRQLLEEAQIALLRDRESRLMEDMVHRIAHIEWMQKTVQEEVQALVERTRRALDWVEARITDDGK